MRCVAVSFVRPLNSSTPPSTHSLIPSTHPPTHSTHPPTAASAWRPACPSRRGRAPPCRCPPWWWPRRSPPPAPCRAGRGTVCVCVRACVRACVCGCVRACVRVCARACMLKGESKHERTPLTEQGLTGEGGASAIKQAGAGGLNRGEKGSASRLCQSLSLFLPHTHPLTSLPLSLYMYLSDIHTHSLTSRKRLRHM